MDEIKVSKKKDFNYVFYLFLKELNGAISLKFYECNEIIVNYNYFGKKRTIYISILKDIISYYRGHRRREKFLKLIENITSKDLLKLFIFSVKLVQIKSLLISEADFDRSLRREYKNIHPLTLKYDEYFSKKSYRDYEKEPLLVLYLLSKIKKRETYFLSYTILKYINGIIREFKNLKKIGIDYDQLFMIFFNERKLKKSIIYGC